MTGVFIYIKKKLGHIPLTQNHINIKFRTTLSRGNHNLCDSGLGKNFFNRTLKAQYIKEKMIKLDFKIKYSFSIQDSVKRMKRQTTD